MDVADFPVFGVFGFPAPAGTVEAAVKVGESVCAFKNTGIAQGFGIAQVDAGVVGKVYCGGKSGCPAAAFLMPDAV